MSVENSESTTGDNSFTASEALGGGEGHDPPLLKNSSNRIHMPSRLREKEEESWEGKKEKRPTP